jgi:hypothetical protein
MNSVETLDLKSTYGTLTRTRRLRAAFEFKNANSTAAWSIMERFVQSERRARRVVSRAEGPGATVAAVGEGLLGGDGIGVG